MREHGVTQEELAAAINSHQVCISRWSTGRFAPPVSIALEICAALQAKTGEALEVGDLWELA